MSSEDPGAPAGRTPHTPHTLIADLFRRESGRLVALLVRRVGAARLDLVEDAVQDALVAAMRTWPLQDVPRNPSGWLYTAARNALTDRLRRTRFECVRDDAPQIAQDPDDAFSDEATFDDDLLRLIALCCHPALTPAARLALTLRLACGLSIEEIAGALLSSPESISQRIVRAKRELRAREASVDVAARELVESRLPGILNAIYLLFDAGYLSTRSSEWLRPVLCADALRIAAMLAAHPDTHQPETCALAALLHFSAARLPARADATGKPVPLAQQDRASWDRGLIDAGFRYFDESIGGDVLTRYHIEAAIAAVHARADSMETTDWTEILGHYDQLCALYPSPVATLNRIIALRYARGAQAAYDAFAASDTLEAVQDSLIYRATRAELHAALGEHDRAAEEFRQAASLAGSNTLAQLFLDRERVARQQAAAGVRNFPA